MRRTAISAAIFFFLGLTAAPRASAGVPDWLRYAAQQPSRTYPNDVNAVYLLSETETTVKDSGETVTHVRFAIKVLRPEGREVAFPKVPFRDETRVNYFKGWSISAKGVEYEAKKDDVAEVGFGSDEVYSDVKAKVMRIPGVDVGTIVGVEWEQKRHPYTFEDQWFFQEFDPVVRARFILHLPANWEYRAAWLHYPEQAPQIQGGTYVWELSDIPRIENEADMPHWRAVAGQLIVTFFSEKTRGRSYSNWGDFGSWYNQLTTGVRDPSPSMQQKVQELAPASMPLLERIKALARFAQRDVRYAAIEIGIGGYQPHPASEIFSNRYGDCKDKATVLSAMLAQIGVKSFYLPVHTDRGIYTEKTPPTMGFNHVILAIQLPDASYKGSFPALFEHPTLGHLLIFDPTSPVVPFGQIPSYEQDNYALLVTGQGGELIHLPLSSPELNKMTRTATLSLMPDGTLKGEVQEVRSGWQAAEGRYTFEHQTTSDRRKILEHFLGHMLGNFQLDSVDAENLDDIDKDLIIHYKFTASHYAKSAGQLLLMRPRVLGEKLGSLDMTKPRHYAYEFDAPTLQTDVFEFSLPEGYKIDELPDAARATFPFGEYTSKIENTGTQLKYSREYKIKTVRVPAEKIGDLGKFFHQINQDERNMAVLKKAN